MKTTKTKELKAFHYVSDYAKDLLDTIPEEFEIDEKREFKFVTLKELGFTKDWIRTKEFLNNDFLQKHELTLCNPEDVFAINKSLKNGEYSYVGMNPIPDRYGDLELFSVYRDNGKSWLHSRSGRPGSEWVGSFRFVFLSRKLELSPSNTQNLPLDTLHLDLARAIGTCIMNGYTVTKNTK